MCKTDRQKLSKTEIDGQFWNWRVNFKTDLQNQKLTKMSISVKTCDFGTVWGDFSETCDFDPVLGDYS